jgi:hypothetical protein
LAWHYCANHNREWGRYGKRHIFKSPSGEQWFGAIAGATLASIVWPLSLPVAYGIEGSRQGGNFFYIPKDKKERIYKDRITALEKEVGIN